VGATESVDLSGQFHHVPASWVTYFEGTCNLNGKQQPKSFTFAVNDVVEVTAFNGALTCLKNNVQVRLVFVAHAHFHYS
jgi:hypothetical protein